MEASEHAKMMAKRLHGREYRREMNAGDKADAQTYGLLVVYGASDDLTEFEGAYSDEEGANNGAEHVFTVVNGKLQIVRERDDEHELEREGWVRPKQALVVNAQWCPDHFAGSWLITSDAPFAEFDIMEDEQLYCRGAVIDVAALCAPAHKADLSAEAHMREVLDRALVCAETSEERLGLVYNSVTKVRDVIRLKLVAGSDEWRPEFQALQDAKMALGSRTNVASVIRNGLQLEADITPPIPSKYHSQNGFEVERFLSDYEAWLKARRLSA